MSTPPFVDAPEGVTVVRPPVAPWTVMLAEPRGPERGNALLVPGFTGSKEDFIAVLAPLAKLGWRVAAMDLPGQNGTPALGGRGSNTLTALAEAVADVIKWLTEHSTAPVHLLGHSAGGLVTANMLLTQQVRVDTWTALCTGPGALPASVQGPVLAFLAVVDHEPMARIWKRIRRMDLAAGPAPDPQVAKFLKRRFLTNDPNSLFDLAQALITTPDQTAALSDHLARPGSPIAHVITGDLDDAWPVPVQRKFALDLPAPFHLLTGVGHSPAAQAPTATVRLLDHVWSAPKPSDPKAEAMAPGSPESAPGNVLGTGVSPAAAGYTADMTLHATLECDRLAPRRARRVICKFLSDHNLDNLTDDAALLTSELVTNAVRHASGPIHLDAYVRHTAVRLEVADDNPADSPQRRQAGIDEESGRGMELVEKLADRWGWRTMGTRKVVWLELSTWRCEPRAVKSVEAPNANPAVG